MKELSVDELHEEARQQWESFSGSQSDLADALDIDRAAVSRAVRHAGLKHAAVQARIVSLLAGVPVQRRSTYEGKGVQHEWIVGA
jgi:hypothetical protein